MPGNIARQFVTFAGVGAVATSVHYVILFLLVEGAQTGPITASSIGAFFGAVVSYVLNKSITFQSGKSHSAAAPRFFTVAILAFISNFLLMVVFTLKAGIPYPIAQVITTAMIIVITFGLNKYWSFADKP